MKEENFAVESEQDLNELLKIKRQKLKDLQEEGKDPFIQTKFDIDTKSIDIKNNFEKYDSRIVKIAGRMMTRRIMGKASFCDIQDDTSKIQVYIKNEIGEEYEAFKKCDIGDIFGVEGYIFKTKKGEISVYANSIILLSKSLQNLPEKFHGLKDQELRYRQRYLDLIVNPDVKLAFLKRSAIIKHIRNFLDKSDFIEVETPILQTIASGGAARPFKTHHNTFNLDMNLRIALELPLKRLIVGGFSKVYEIGRCFRNEGISIRHNPEFTMLELYQAYADYNDMMDLTESIIKSLAKEINNSTAISYQGTEIDFSKPFERITMVDAVKKYANIDFSKISSLEEAISIANEHNIKYEKYHTKGDILNLFFEKYAEAKLIQPTFLIHHPIEISPLCKKIPSNPEYVERFELFIYGRECANAYSELNDPIDQRERFMKQEALKDAGNEEATAIDEDFLHALEYGMPPTGGLGIGIDRLVMFFTDSPSIRDILLFPTMKPIG